MDTIFINVFDVISGLIWSVLLLIIVGYKKSNNVPETLKPYFIPSYLFRSFFGILFALAYIFILGGGDTKAYFQGANTLNNLFVKSPILYLESMWSDPSSLLLSKHFDSMTGYPPSWIYKEKEGWFVCKIASVLSLITFKSYFAMTLIIAYFSFSSSFRLLALIEKLKLHSTRNLVFAFLLIPSVGFWCSGLSKDSIILIATMYLLWAVFEVLINLNHLKFKNILLILICVYVIYSIRPFMLMAISVPFLLSFGTRLTRRFESNWTFKTLLRSVYVVIGLASIYFFMTSPYILTLINEATIIKDDFTSNDIYTGKKYDIGIVDFSLLGLIKSLPIVVFYGFYRPFITESLTPTLFLNGIESLIFMFLTLKFFLSKNIIKKLSMISKNELLLFAILFAVILSFIAAFTSVIFGVLVRMRAILLPFLLLILTIKLSDNDNITETKELE